MRGLIYATNRIVSGANILVFYNIDRLVGLVSYNDSSYSEAPFMYGVCRY